MNILIIYFLFFFTIPCVYSFINIPSLTLFLIIICQSFFYLPFILFSKSKTSNKINLIRLPNKVFFFFVLIYYTIDYQWINEVIYSILENQYFLNGRDYALARYSGDLIVTFSNRIRVIFAFILAFILPTIDMKFYKKSLIYLVLIIIESATFSRSGIIISLFSILSVYIFNNSYKFRYVSISRLVKYTLVFSFFGFIMFAFSGYGRVYNKSNAFEIVINKFGKYTLANFEALAIWAKTYDYSELGLGRESFGIFNKILGIEKEAGNYLPVNTNYGVTNLFTVNRSIFEDFWFFSSAFWFFIGYQCFKLLNNTRNSSIYYPIQIASSMFVLYWFYSPFYFNSYLLSFLVFSFLIKFKPIVR